ncbi:MAG: hypothetical protein LBN21_10125 [Treponema sp.]|jgi:hypothetical protein|nr:hypothetical protein [Treponema sp.]
MIHRKNRILGLMFILFPVFTVFGVEVTVPRMELAARGASEDGEFVISTDAAVDIALIGGYKYGIYLGFSFDSANLGRALAYRDFAFGAFGIPALTGGAGPTTLTDDDYLDHIDQLNSHIDQLNDRFNNQAALSFRIARAMVRELFKLPLEFAFFAGIGDSFCSGSEFSARYGNPDITTDFTGFYYFPEGIGGNPYRGYDGLHYVQGTGVSFAFTKWTAFVPMLYLYQDFPFFDQAGNLSKKPHFSGDLRFLINTEFFKLEAFGGFTAGKDEKPDIRGGALAHFKSNRGAEFLLQAGIPGYIQDDNFSIDNLYFLMEPRLNFGLLALHVTFFYHPVEYLHVKTEEERGKADINIKLLVGNAGEFGIEGGLEATVGLKIYEQEDFSFKLSPFIAFVSDGLRWDVKLRINPLLWETPEELFEIFAGVRTAY